MFRRRTPTLSGESPKKRDLLFARNRWGSRKDSREIRSKPVVCLGPADLRGGRNRRGNNRAVMPAVKRSPQCSRLRSLPGRRTGTFVQRMSWSRIYRQRSGCRAVSIHQFPIEQASASLRACDVRPRRPVVPTDVIVLPHNPKNVWPGGWRFVAAARRTV